MSAYSPCFVPSFFGTAYMLLNQCYINTVTQKPRSQGDEVTTSGLAVTPPHMQIKYKIYMSLLLDEEYEAEIPRHKWIIKSVIKMPSSCAWNSICL